MRRLLYALAEAAEAAVSTLRPVLMAPEAAEAAVVGSLSQSFN